MNTIIRKDTSKHYRIIRNIILAHRHASIKSKDNFARWYFYIILLLIALSLAGCDVIAFT